MATHLISVALLLATALFGFKSLHLFATNNGLLKRLQKCITDSKTPGGRPLRTLTTNARFPAIDLQLRAVAIFLLIFCEDLQNPDADVVGFSFAANWGVSWILIVLESLREYSRDRFMSWITIPGILIFNQSNAVFTPLYLAIRLAVASSSTSAESLAISSTDLKIIPWSFLTGYMLPLFAMALPGVLVNGVNSKHVIASWYQQWNLYVSLVHAVLVRWWNVSGDSDDLNSTAGKAQLLSNLRPVYMFTMAFAVSSLWVPVIISALAWTLKPRNNTLGIRSVFAPPTPWSKIQCRSAFEGGKWLLQWDGIIGSLASAVWAIALFNQSRVLLAPELPLKALLGKTISYLVLGGPMAVSTGFLWERDALVLSGKAASLM